MVCPSATATEFTTDPALREPEGRDRDAPEAVAWALAQPPEIDVGEIVVRSAAQP